MLYLKVQFLECIILKSIMITELFAYKELASLHRMQKDRPLDGLINTAILYQ